MSGIFLKNVQDARYQYPVDLENPQCHSLHCPYQGAVEGMEHASERSLGVQSARTFNFLPSNLRNDNSGDFALFKNHLDIFLSTVPD